MDNSYYSFSSNETNPNEVENTSNKRQRLNDDDQYIASSDFLNFDYPFDINPYVIPDQISSAAIHDDFFMFVTDNEQQQQQQQQSKANGSSDNNPTVENSSNSITVTENNLLPTAVSSLTLPCIPTPAIQKQRTINISKPNLQPHPITTVNNNNNATQSIITTEVPNQSVFTIVVGGKQFRLSWESLKSDGPNNFFLEYFRKKKNTRVMYIDRDPEIFELIARHLRGYYIRPSDDIQNQALLYDATYYGLNRLKKSLQEVLYINVGGRIFRIPWDLFQKDGTRNFFTGPLKHSLLAPHTEQGNSPPLYIDRDPDIFADILNHLRGYTIHIRDEMHRKNLLRDAHYYVFRQLSDKLLTAQQTVAGFGDCSNPEVLLLLNDVRIINILPSESINEEREIKRSDIRSSEERRLTQVQYKRITEGPPHALLVQVSDLGIQIHKSTSHHTIRLEFTMNESDMKKMKQIANAARATEGVNTEFYLDDHCAITIDDIQVKSLQQCIDENKIEINWKSCSKHHQCQLSQSILQRAICSVHLIDKMLTLCVLRFEAISSKFQLNLKRQFLSN